MVEQPQSLSNGMHPLLQMARAFEGFDTRLMFHTGYPVTEGWIPVSALSDRALINRLLDESDTAGARLRNVAASQIGASLACAVIRPLMAMLHQYESAPVLDQATTFLRRQEGRFRDLCIVPARLLSTQDTDHPAVTPVRGTEDLLRHLADTIVLLLEPALQVLRAEGRFGLKQLWGSVLDMIGATSLLVGRLADLDQTRVWQHAERLCTLVKLRAGDKVKVPTPFAVPWDGADALFVVKGTCCLRYREHGLRAGEPDTTGDAYCKTCPFLGEQDRVQHCADQLARDNERIRAS